jgi:acetyl esterase/lipase
MPSLPPPNREDVVYGPHAGNTLDFWQASSAEPAPLVVLLHGAGGDKRDFAQTESALIRRCLDGGVSAASVSYRLGPATPYPAPMLDGTRAVQFLRTQADQWRLDPARVAAAARSAGAGIALWLGFHDDLVQPAAEDPAARCSTRLRCVLVRNAQTSYDPRVIKQHIPGGAWRHPALQVLFALDEAQRDALPAEKMPLFEQASPLTHLSAGAPPVYMTYQQENAPLAPDATAGRGIHHPTFGMLLKERMDALGVECVLRCGPDSIDASAEMAFLERHLA